MQSGTPQAPDSVAAQRRRCQEVRYLPRTILGWTVAFLTLYWKSRQVVQSGEGRIRDIWEARKWPSNMITELEIPVLNHPDLHHILPLTLGFRLVEHVKRGLDDYMSRRALAPEQTRR